MVEHVSAVRNYNMTSVIEASSKLTDYKYSVHGLVQNEFVSWLWACAHTIPGVPAMVHLIYGVCTLFILEPLAILYLHGPAMYGYGFWAGKEFPEICSALTGVSSGFWASHPDECTNLIRKRFDSFVIILFVSLYAYMIFLSVRRVLVSKFG